MLVACQNCGAPLDVQDGKMFVPCSYCGQTTKVRGSRTLMQETPKNWAPPATWSPQPAWEPPPIQPAAPPVVTSHGNPGLRFVILAITMTGTFAAVAIPLYFQGAFSAIPGFGLDLEGAPEIREVDFDREAVPPDLVGEASSGVDLSTVGGTGCFGTVGRRASVVLRTSVPRRVSLAADAPYDAVMALRTEDGVFRCDDDSNGNLDPRIDAVLPAGTHRVWVGTLHETGGSFTLHIVSELAAGNDNAGLALEGPPSLATLAATGGATPFAQYEGNLAFATIAASQARGGCSGFLPASPHLAIQLDSPVSVRFLTRSPTGQDLVMMLRDANGVVVCDDDSAGAFQPQIDHALPAGTTRVWVGTFSAASGAPHFELLVGAPGRTSGEVVQGTSTSGAPALGVIDLETLRRNTRYEGRTSGNNPASSWLSSCRGFIGSQPDLVIESRTPRDVELTTRSRGDLVLLIRGPDGTVTCDDDSGRESNPLIHQRWEPGTHEVFVGNFHPGTAVPYTLLLDERRAPSMRAADRGDK